MAATPPRKPTIIQYFRTGLYTRRSALFAPLRVIGIQVVLLNDALIDGQDMELLDTYQLQRRPGFARFCSQQLAGGEIINQFMSRDSSAAPATVFPVFDSNQRVATFSNSAITTLWTKGSVNQAFSQAVGSQLYIANGTANGQKRYDIGAGALHGMGIAAPTTAPKVSPPTGANATFWQPGIAYAGLGILLDPNGNLQIGGAGTSGAQPPVWSPSFLVRTPDGTVSGGWVNAGPPQVWQASTAFVPFSGAINNVIIDSNGNIQACTTGGTTGATQPVWSTTVTGTTNDGTVVWTCKSNLGAQTVFSGYQYMYVYSTQAPTVAGGYYHRSDGSPVSFSTGAVFGPYSYNVTGALSTNTDVASVDIYRTKDGGASFDYAGSVANNPAGGTWTFADSILDANLTSSLVIPLGSELLSDPPPGSTGSHAPAGDAISYMAWWQGRFWAIAGNKVYFTSGPDVDNGDPYACWPPGNVFTFPGPPIALTGTSAGLMLVWLRNSVKIIAGGPTTLSYYNDDLLDNFGISSPNCVVKDGDNVHVLTTQGQVFTLTVSAKTEVSALIADLVQNFPENASYLTNHRNGLDNGLFLGDGSTNILRYGNNVQAWSTIYKPVGGIRAVNSVETTVGNFTLCAGRATPAGFILGRSLTSVQDDGQNYSACFATIGNIVLSQPLEPLVPVYRIAGYFAAGGQVPTLSVLPNEINASVTPFITIPNPIPEPALGAAPSQTLLAREWNLYEMLNTSTSLLMHHLQVKIAFPAENFASTIYGLALKHDQEN